MKNSARDTTVTNCQDNSYQTVHETLTWQKVNRTHKKQCTKTERNKQSTEHIQNSARGTNTTNNPTQHIKNGAQNTTLSKNLTKHIQNSA